MAAELILHHLVLGLKGLSWRSVDIPPALLTYDTTEYWQGGNDADIHD
jgi:hypothetical protein